MPLAMLTIKKELHGLLYSMHTFGSVSLIIILRLEALRAAGAPLLVSSISHFSGLLSDRVLIEFTVRTEQNASFVRTVLFAYLSQHINTYKSIPLQ